MIRSACITDKGKIRDVNEDSILCIEDEGFFMLADGVGGHNSGEVASGMAVGLAAEFIKLNPINKIEAKDVFAHLFDCLKSINKTICGRSNEQDECQGMATTSIMLVIKEGRAYIANVGDSRAYILKNGIFERITEDHTYVNELLKHGQISKDEAKIHPKRNYITRALGIELSISPDFYNLELGQGDRILLCTDGLYNEVDDDTLADYMKTEKDVKILVENLLELACNNGGKDNISISCADVIK